MSTPRIGVFACDCGDQIGSALDVDALVRTAAGLPGVVAARRVRHACSPDGLLAIRAAITEEGLERVVVAGCTPRTLEPRFRAACAGAGLGSNHFEMVDVREGCAWVHQGQRDKATAKAASLVRVGVARTALCQACTPASADVVAAALVIGGGLAGMTAALALANAGLPVKLVEREKALGGMLRDTVTLYPDRRRAVDLVAEKIEAVTAQPRIDVCLGSQVTGVTGTVGRYTVHVGSADGADGQAPFDVGAIVVATGARAVQPWGTFGYDGRRVVTQLEFERELAATEGGARPAGLPASVVMVLCAGGYDEAAPTCSGLCCAAALKQAIEVKAADPQAEVTVLFRELCLPGEGSEERVAEAQHAGVRFVRYAPTAPPLVTGEAVVVRDGPGVERCQPCERVVLASPPIPQADAGVLARLLGIPQDADGFFPEARYRLRPENCADRGIYVCGAAHHPADWATAEFEATSAAFQALRHVRAGKVNSHAPAAVVNEEVCTGCASCAQVCPFGGITMHARNGALAVSRVDPLLCKGCGSCAVACPARAIDLPVDGNAQMLAQIDAVLADRAQNGSPAIVAFGCEWSGHAAAELAGASRLSYPPEVRLLRVACAARVDPLHILWAFLGGADGVFVGACPPGNCHYTGGNRRALERIRALRGQLAGNGFDPRRLRMEWITPDDPGDFVTKITDFADLVLALGRASSARAGARRGE